MADSKRQTIMDSVVSALSAVSSLWVSETLIHWEEVDKAHYPITAFPVDADETRTGFSLFGVAGDNDAKATLAFTVTCYCYRADNDGAKLRKLRTDLIRDVEAVLQTATSLWAISALLDLRPMRVITDKGVVKNFSIFDYEFEVDYLYDHVGGG